MKDESVAVYVRASLTDEYDCSLCGEHCRVVLAVDCDRELHEPIYLCKACLLSNMPEIDRASKAIERFQLGRV